MPTHYETLGVASNADPETIRRAYVAVAKANHPDRRQTDDEARRARADERIRAANAAWQVLREPGRRADYDRSLRTRPSDIGGASPSPGGRPGADPRPRPGGPGTRPSPPSGIVVPAGHASFWRYGPIAVVLAVLAAVLVVSAYATSGGSGSGSASSGQEVVPAVGECVLVVGVGGRLAPARVGCGTDGANRVVAVVDSPRPCPSGAEPLVLSDQKTALCLQAED